MNRSARIGLLLLPGLIGIAIFLFRENLSPLSTGIVSALLLSCSGLLLHLQFRSRGSSRPVHSRPAPGERPELSLKADLNNFLNAMNEGLLAVDPYERIVLANRAAAGIVGSTPEGIQGKYLWDVVSDPKLQSLCQQALRSTTRVPLESATEVDGRFLEISAASLPGEGAILLLLDVTDLHRSERVRKDFVANVSHELRTPLTSILGYVETLHSGAWEETENARRFLGKIRKHAIRMSSMIDELLELARIESGTAELRFQPVRLGDLLRNVTDSFRDEAQKKGLDLALAIPESLPAVSGEPRLLERALSNLVDNAIKYTPSGSVSLSVGAENGRVFCTVRDTGAGIGEEDQERIFERFYRADPSRSGETGGTGLGLSIVKRVALAHDGEVHLESEPGKGSVFTISLPTFIIS